MTNDVADELKARIQYSDESDRDFGLHCRLFDEIERLRGSAEPSARLTEATFQAKEGEPLQATAQFQGDAVKEWALVMVQWFREKGGINYVACDLRDPTTGEAYEIVMQKAGGRTPAQDLAEMRAQLNR